MKNNEPLVVAQSLDTFYGASHILRSVDFTVAIAVRRSASWAATAWARAHLLKTHRWAW